ncbi:serine/threonine-protein kinase Chk1-like [Oratosquilla oratoria]|uniref:serine/threonine-protein kinase Chk1-like n=1 Tax=Oratosquilla oratoria TaxID=337810 RepID=UPI003F7653B5
MRWKEVRHLGKGGYATVKLVKGVSSGFICARKTIKIFNVERQLEVKIHCKLDHKNVVAFLGEYRDSENTYVFLEYADSDTLQDRIGQKGVSERRARLYFKQLIGGVKYKHSRNIVHRDLKPENLFLTKNDDLKIGDFGLAGEFVKGEFLTKICGTSAYIAPEVFTGRYLGEPNDVWACGIVLFETRNWLKSLEDPSDEQRHKLCNLFVFDRRNQKGKTMEINSRKNFLPYR